MRLFNFFENRLNGKKTAVSSLEIRQFPNNKMASGNTAIKNSIIKKDFSFIFLNFLLFALTLLQDFRLTSFCFFFEKSKKRTLHIRS